MMFDDIFDDADSDENAEGDNASPNIEPSLKNPAANPDLLGHEEHEKLLLSLFNDGRLPHSLIFAGPMGIGKTTAAFRLARFLLRHGGDDGNQHSLFGEGPEKKTSLFVDEHDPVFSKVAAGGHPDLRFFERPLNDRGLKKTVVDVETVRKIAPFLRMRSAEGGWRVVIVDEADMMNKNAQNAILKILEEPPPKALLILICNRLGAMLPTIRSRCRTVHFSPLPPNALHDLLKRGAPGVTPDDRAMLAAMSDGSMGRALTLHEEKGIATLQTVIALLERWPNWDWARIHPLADNLSREEKAYDSFCHIIEWVVQSLVRGKVAGQDAVPEMLRTERLLGLESHYSLGQWIEICEKLGAHFTAIQQGNLDKRQGVLGAFGILGGQN